MKAKTVALFTVIGMLAIALPVEANSQECSGGDNVATLVSQAGHHVYATGNSQDSRLPSVWAESNGEVGLQITAKHCLVYDDDENRLPHLDFDMYPADTKKL